MIYDFFRDRKVKRLLRTILRSKGIKNKDELEDALQDVYTALIAWSRKNDVDSAERLCAVARGIAKNVGTKYWRTKAVHSRRNVGNTGEPDEFGPLPNPSAIDLIDIKRILDELEQLVESGELTEQAAAVMIALAEETSLADHANDTNQSYAAVRKAAERAREVLARRLAERGMLDVGLGKLATRAAQAAVAVAVVLLFYYGARRRGLFNQPVAQHDPKPPPAIVDAGTPPMPEVPSPAPTVMVDTTRERRAEELTLDAQSAFKKGDLTRCYYDVGMVYHLVDAGADQALRELRKKCEKGAREPESILPLDVQRRRRDGGARSP